MALEPTDRERVGRAIERLADGTGRVLKLRDRPGLYRQRVGDLRIVYEPDWRTRRLLVVAIAHRRDVYRRH